jgi:hypothetical protein
MLAVILGMAHIGSRDPVNLLRSREHDMQLLVLLLVVYRVREGHRACA